MAEPQRLEYLSIELSGRRALSRCNIVRARFIGSCREKVCRRYILNKAVISHHAVRLAGEVVQSRQFFAQKSLSENSYHTRFTMRDLPWSVYIAIPEYDMAEIMLLLIKADIMFAAKL